MAQINPYLTFNGNCEEAFTFYKSVFGGEYSDFNRFDAFPSSEKEEMNKDTAAKIMHVALPINKETFLMGSDAPPNYPPILFGQNMSISVVTANNEEADKIFNELSEGGQITMPIETAFWGAYFGMLMDKFGVAWMVSCG